MNFETGYSMLIDGALATGDAQIEVINPANGQIFATAPDCSPEQLDIAVAAARRAFRTWRAVPIGERHACLRKAGDILEANAEQLARLFTREQGRPTDGALSEIGIAVAWLRAYAAMIPPTHVIDNGDGQRVETSYVPLGAVCAISPWNFPVNLSIWKIAPALAAGRVVICDRFADSPRMYQGLSRGDLRGMVDQLHSLMIGREPDLTLLIDMDPEVGLTRALARKGHEERFEDFGPELQRKMRQGFLGLAREFPDRFRVIDGNRDFDSVAAEVEGIVLDRLA